MAGRTVEEDATLHVLSTSLLARTEDHLRKDHGYHPAAPEKRDLVSLHMEAHGLTADDLQPPP